MADYNIYIHAIGTGGATSQNPTIPWSARDGGESASPTSPQGTAGNIDVNGTAKAIIKASSIAQNPDSLIGQAVSNIAKAFPIVAAAYAVVKLGETIIDNCVENYATVTGDYRGQTIWSGLIKPNLRVVFHPASSFINSIKTETTWRLENSKRTQQRELFGDSIINSYTNKGV